MKLQFCFEINFYFQVQHYLLLKCTVFVKDLVTMSSKSYLLKNKKTNKLALMYVKVDNDIWTTYKYNINKEKIPDCLFRTLFW